MAVVRPEVVREGDQRTGDQNDPYGEHAGVGQYGLEGFHDHEPAFSRQQYAPCGDARLVGRNLNLAGVNALVCEV